MVEAVIEQSSSMSSVPPESSILEFIVTFEPTGTDRMPPKFIRISPLDTIPELPTDKVVPEPIESVLLFKVTPIYVLVPPVVKVELPERVNKVFEVVKVPPVVVKLSPRTKVLLVASRVAAPPNVPPPVNDRILGPDVKIPPVRFQALVTAKSVLAP